MLEQLLKVLEGDCEKFKLKFEDKQYKLTLDDGKTFTGTDIDKVLNDAVDYLDNQEFSEEKLEINPDEVFKKVGYGSEEHY